MKHYNFLRFDVNKKDYSKALISFLLAVSYSYFLSSFPNELFRDRDNYIIYAILSNELGEKYSTLSYFFNEPLFLYYNEVLSNFFLPDVVPKVGVFFVSFTLAYFILKYASDFFVVLLGFLLLFFVSYTFHLQLVVLRQGIATALLIWFVYFFWDNKKVFYFLCFLLPFLHVSFFIVSSLLLYDYILSRLIRDVKLRILLITVTVFLASFMMLGVASSLGVRQAGEEHLEVNENGGGGFVLFSFILIFLFFRGLNNVYRDKYGRIAILGLIAYLAFYFTLPISGRLIGTFLPFFYIYVVSCNNLKVVFSAFIFLILSMFLYYGSLVNGSLTLKGVRYLNSILGF